MVTGSDTVGPALNCLHPVNPTSVVFWKICHICVRRNKMAHLAFAIFPGCVTVINLFREERGGAVGTGSQRRLGGGMYILM